MSDGFGNYIYIYLAGEHGSVPVKVYSIIHSRYKLQTQFLKATSDIFFLECYLYRSL